MQLYTTYSRSYMGGSRMVQLREPLHTAARGAAHLMATGRAGTAAQDGVIAQYAQLIGHCGTAAVLGFMRVEVEGCTGNRLTLREADPSLCESARHRVEPLPANELLLFQLVVCDFSRPARPVTVLRSSDGLYIVTTPLGSEPTGLIV